jgi:hypothetical protein
MRNEFTRNTSRPPGRSRRAASGTQRSGSPTSTRRIRRSRDRSFDPVGNRLRVAVQERKLQPCSRCRRRAVSSCAAELSMPDRRRRPCARARRNVSGSAPEFDRVLAREVVGEHSHLRFRDVPDTPCRHVLCQFRSPARRTYAPSGPSLRLRRTCSADRSWNHPARHHSFRKLSHLRVARATLQSAARVRLAGQPPPKAQSPMIAQVRYRGRLNRRTGERRTGSCGAPTEGATRAEARGNSQVTGQGERQKAPMRR